jgi:hypothetical protein
MRNEKSGFGAVVELQIVALLVLAAAAGLLQLLQYLVK